MIGPAAGTAGFVETGRIPTEKPREVLAAQSSTEEATRTEAANEQAAANRSAIVGALDEALADLGVPSKANQPFLRIEQDRDSGRFIYKSIDRETGEVVREWPEEEVRRALKTLGNLRGALLDRSV